VSIEHSIRERYDEKGFGLPSWLLRILFYQTPCLSINEIDSSCAIDELSQPDIPVLILQARLPPLTSCHLRQV
jgi:hypothetical protein